MIEIRPDLQRAAATALASFMSEVSEDCYCAQWMHDLEFDLWAIAQGDSRPGYSADGDRQRAYGMNLITDQEVETLLGLSELAGGWITWLDDADERGLSPMDEWLKIYAERRVKWDA